MMLHEGDAHTFLDFFHNTDHHMVAAIFFLSIEAKDQAIIGDMIDAVTEIDEALGEDIGLFIFGPQCAETLLASDEGFQVLAGRRIDKPRPFRSRTSRIKKFFEEANPVNYGGPYDGQIRSAVLRSSTSIVPQFCNIFDIDKARLPVVCAVIRGSSDAIIVPLKNRLDVRELVIVSKLVNERIVELKTRATVAMDGIQSLEHQIRQSEDWSNDLARNKNRVMSCARELEYIHSIVVCPQIQAHLRTKTLSQETIDHVVSRIPSEISADVAADPRLRVIRNCVVQIQKIERKFTSLAESDEMINLVKNKEFLASLSEATRKALHETLADKRLSVANIRSDVTRAAPWLGRAMKFLEGGQKIAGLISKAEHNQRILDILRSTGIL